MREIGPEEAEIRAQTGVGLSGLSENTEVVPFRSVPYDPKADRDPCPWCGKRH